MADSSVCEPSRLVIGNVVVNGRENLSMVLMWLTRGRSPKGSGWSRLDATVTRGIALHLGERAKMIAR